MDDLSGVGNSLDFKFRIYDSRIGRFFSVDPLNAHYAWNSPYAFAENNPIKYIDLEGLEKAERSEYTKVDPVFGGVTSAIWTEVNSAAQITFVHHIYDPSTRTTTTNTVEVKPADDDSKRVVTIIKYSNGLNASYTKEAVTTSVETPWVRSIYPDASPNLNIRNGNDKYNGLPESAKNLFSDNLNSMRENEFENENRATISIEVRLNSPLSNNDQQRMSWDIQSQFNKLGYKGKLDFNYSSNDNNNQLRESINLTVVDRGKVSLSIEKNKNNDD